MLQKETIIQEIQNIKTEQELDTVYDKYLGKKWLISSEFKTLWTLSAEERKNKGAELSELKSIIDENYKSKKSYFTKIRIDKILEQEIIDITTPWLEHETWNYTLLAKARREVEDIFKSMWFLIEYGNDVVIKYENFFSLNIPATHPATEMHDTFYLNETDKNGDNLILRTHTSAMQNILIKKYWVPLKIVVPGKVYRYENTDVSHDTMFRQMEWVVIDKWISISTFKQLAENFLSALFGKQIKIRIRPWYFPFVEPWFEIDASCPMCGGSWCSFCKQTGWSEILWAGMIHPKVLEQAGVDPEEYTWFAFGMWFTRLVAIKYAINDVRLLTNPDLRFIKSF